MYRKILFTFLIFICVIVCYSQDSTIKNNFLNEENVKSKDITDVWNSVFKTKENKIDKNKNRQIQINFLPAIGYSLQTGFAANVSSNISFKLSRLPLQKVSNIYTSFTYSQYNQLIFPIQANIWSKNNKLNLITDIRFIQYPSDIFGLGGRIDPNQGFTINFGGLKFHQTIQKEFTKNLAIGVGIYYDNFWNIKALDSLKQNVAQTLAYRLGTSQRAVGFIAKITYDSRLNQINAKQGLFATVLFRPNYTFLGSNNNWSNVQIEARYYVPFPKRSKNIIAFWSYNIINSSKEKPPYLLMPSTGWDDTYNTGRGYIQGRFRGKSMYYFETEYRVRCTKNDLFGAVVFCNAQKFSGELSRSYKNIKLGYGLGLRLKLNKYSNTNVCIDYGFGENGSKGIFVNIGEVF